MADTGVLLINCPDQRGIVAAVSEFLFRNDGNILHADQHKDTELNLFFMRVEWELSGFAVGLDQFTAAFAEIASRFAMTWRIARSTARPRLALFVSKYDHCLADLLYRWRCGELACEIALVIGNHEDARPLTEFYGVPFHLIPVRADGKDEAERR